MQVAAAEIIAALPLPCILIRRDERIEAANAPALSLLGQGIVGRHFITALRAPTLLDAIENCLRDGTARRLEFQSSDGRQETSYQTSVASITLDGVPRAFWSPSRISPKRRRRDRCGAISWPMSAMNCARR